MSFLALKMLHILSAAILFGTGIGIAFFAWVGSRRAIHSNDIGALRNILRMTVFADFCFTAPAVVVQLITGFALVKSLGWSFASPWMMAVGGLFVLVGVCWLPVLWIQMRLSTLATGAETVESLPPVFHRFFAWWFALGIPAFAAMLGLFWMMVAKPLAVT